MDTGDKEKIRGAVRKRYGSLAGEVGMSSGPGPVAPCCGTGEPDSQGGPASSCCSGPPLQILQGISSAMGYREEDLRNVPEGANMGLGCGNPVALASLREGETVVDLGCGGGFDCFLAARQVGDQGKVIGVDMTPEMIAKARENAKKSGAGNVEFRLGEIEHLPVADNTADIVISNCVINLSPDKEKVYKDAFRVLKPGGRLAISDVLATKELPAEVKEDLALLTACIGGAATIEETAELLRRVGFEEVKITPNEKSRELIQKWVPGKGMEGYVVSAYIEAVKPPA